MPVTMLKERYGHSVHRHCLSDSMIEQCSPELNAKNGCRAGLNPTKFD